MSGPVRMCRHGRPMHSGQCAHCNFFEASGLGHIEPDPRNGFKRVRIAIAPLEEGSPLHFTMWESEALINGITPDFVFDVDVPDGVAPHVPDPRDAEIATLRIENEQLLTTLQNTTETYERRLKRLGSRCLKRMDDTANLRAELARVTLPRDAVMHFRAITAGGFPGSQHAVARAALNHAYPNEGSNDAE